MAIDFPDSAFGYRLSRIACRAARWHTRFCVGRPDHVRNGQVIDPARWS